MNPYPGPALVTLATSFLLFACAAYVGRCRIRFGIKAPATSGHPQFEIAHRIQANTVENSVAFLPVLWVFASSVSSLWATVLGGVWLLARVWYAIAYARDPRTRGAGFLLSMLCFGALGIGAAVGVVLGMLG
ncbi:MAG: putative relative of glutathione S-transferase, MAPEG superfamily [Candidatus Accumulibacter adjunctus]|uniref:Relative of glutathione S-transferase, MAPEG superfamily n=1 Tax=Candidatus Accumulibacter adjunctus TaxID=1454001 RepID=A0A011MY15_9PROT|nr:MAG: putative relative of glutathione S-transferase, MAPEG superfamily [Candidatus Accumulibacter adjunctus]